MISINVSVTNLAEFVSRSGDIAGGSYGSVSGIEGTRLHQKIFEDLRKQYGDAVSNEDVMRWDYISDSGLSMSVSGRLDALLLEKNKAPRIFEIKSFNAPKTGYKNLERPEHLTQLKLYGAMYLFQNTDVLDVTLTLRYVSVTTLEYYEESFDMTVEEAESFFDEVCEEYAEFAQLIIDYRSSMYDSVQTLKFPYSSIRNGQKEFMQRVLKALTSMEALFVEAPTGIGKTISTLYPAIKGLKTQKYDKIFYLTAKSATRDVACKALDDMRDNGLFIRSILLRSKEQMCPFETKCDAKYCELAKGYYKRLKPALKEVLMHDKITPELITKIASEHKICPHEFMVNTMEYCTVVIGDYNHIFHPRVSLMSDELDDGRTIALVDEAHNMVERGRDMFSASFSLEMLDRMITDFKGKNEKVMARLYDLRHYFNTISRCFDTNTSCFAALEGANEHRVLKTEGWEGMREKPKNLRAKIWFCLNTLLPVLDSLPKGQARQTAMEFYFEARYFLTVLELYLDDSYIIYAEKTGENIVITLYCLDCSAKMDKIVKDRLPVVFFSATLSPYEYYRNTILGKDADYADYLNLPSPFPPENLDVIIDDSISTSYVNRASSIIPIADRIAETLKGRTGNYMVFFPSFEYMGQIMAETNKRLKEESESSGIKLKLISQIPEMNITEKQEFLDSFEDRFDGLLLGSAVLGGHFGEGIDLVGDRLSGVIIVGVGLPKLNPVRQILSNYYAEKFGDGFAFAYRFPGWQKVLQAVGRVIRTENDTGFALLIDARLAKPEYIKLFPDHWNT